MSAQSSKRVAIVTGANRGIGKAIALALAKDGFDLVVSDLPDNPCTEILHEMAEFGGRYQFSACDVREENQVRELVLSTLSTFDRLDVFVANAGIFSLNPIVQTNRDQMQKLVDTNIYGTLYCIKHAGTAMIGLASSGKTTILSTLTGGRNPGGFMQGGYVSTKFAIRGLVQTAAMEFGPHGITVNAYVPGVSPQYGGTMHQDC
ncbi:hypothetical protein C8J57DRAFT_1058253 [Mycena rebaudengoi]|nr:hypothetical protein C8J57DRAFT_1058253 [Mycena rebaudengoi]